MSQYIIIIILAILHALVTARVTSRPDSPSTDDLFLVDLTEDVFACPTGYTYLTMKDYSERSLIYCQKLKGDDLYVLDGGDTVDTRTLLCSAIDSYCIASESSVCVNATITILDVLASPMTCSKVQQVMTIEEANVYSQEVCQKMDDFGLATVGIQGSISGKALGCQVKEWDESTTNYTVCVERKVESFITVSNVTTDVCGGDTKSLAPVEDVLASKDQYCGLLEEGQSARLCGGASITKTGGVCGVVRGDRSPKTIALCEQ